MQGNEYCHARRPAQLAAALVVLGLTLSVARAASFESDAASDDWDDAAAWTGGAGFPGAGDDVTILHDRVIDGSREFGSSTSNSFWSTSGTRIIMFGGGTSRSMIHSGNSTFRLTAASLNIGKPDGTKTWSFTNAVGSTFLHEVAGTLFLTSGKEHADKGVFVNEGTYRFTAAPTTISHNEDASFVNRGLVRNESGGESLFVNTTEGVFSNDVGGVMEASGDGSILRINSKIILDGGGTWRAFSNATIRIVPLAPGVLAIQSGTVLHGDVASTGTVELSGYWNTDLIGVATGNVVLGVAATVLYAGADISINMDISGASGGTAANASPGTLGFAAGSIAVQQYTITNNVSMRQTGSGVIIRDNTLGGTFVNASGVTYTHAAAGQLKIICATFRNEGTFELITGGGEINIRRPNGRFANNGLLVAKSGAASTVKVTDFFSTGGFANPGTIDVQSGKLDVAAAINIPQFDSGALTGGTYDVTGTLDLNRGADITIIDTNAIVRLRGAEAAFTEFDGNLTTVNGTFGLYSGMVYNATGDLVVPGILEFGLSDSDQSEFVVKTGISNAANVTLTGGKVSIVDQGLTTPGTYTLMEFTGTRTGVLSLSVVPPNGLGYKLKHLDQMVQLNVSGGGGAIILYY